ncbi:hypothetical protein D3C87_1315450 [compost metagenome]
MGTSLGGFESLYAAAHAKFDYRPLAGVVISPLSDIEKFTNYDQTVLPTAGLTAGKLSQYHDFYEPYIRRVKATTSGLPNAKPNEFLKYNHTFLEDQLATSFLIIHDEWDSITPIAHSQSLAANRSDIMDSLWYYQTGNLNLETASLTHNLESPAWKTWVNNAFAESYLLKKLYPSAPGPLIIYYSFADLNSFFGDIQMQQAAGRNMSGAAARLADLCDGRFTLVDYNPAAGIPDYASNAVVAMFINSFWPATSGSVNAGNVEAYLRTNGLPPP